jgi:hypothetical protein
VRLEFSTGDSMAGTLADWNAVEIQRHSMHTNTYDVYLRVLTQIPFGALFGQNVSNEMPVKFLSNIEFVLGNSRVI